MKRVACGRGWGRSASVGAAFLAAAAVASAESKTLTVVFRADQKILVDGKASGLDAIEKSFADEETDSHPPDVRVRIQMEEGASFGPVHTVIETCVKHKVLVDSLDVTSKTPLDASRKPETVHVEMRYNEKEKSSAISLDHKDVADLYGGAPTLKSLVAPVTKELLARTANNGEILADVLVIGGPGRARLSALAEAIVAAKVRTIRFAYKDV